MQHNTLEDMFAIIAAGFVFFVIIIGSGIGLWWALNYNPHATIALVALYGVVQLGRTQIQNPIQSLREIWFLFWFDNEWYKLVLLLTGMWSLTAWV